MNSVISILVLTSMLLADFLPQEKVISQDLMGLIETERNFAKLSTEKGMVRAFLAYFAEEGVNFQPYPTKVRQSFSKLPASTGTPRSVLNWAPVYGDIALSGDLGYSTGPYTLTAAEGSTQHGLFFSVWKKQKDGSWKVAADMGVPLEAPFASLDAPFEPAHSASVRRTEEASTTTKLKTAEEEFFKLAAAAPAEKAWGYFLADDAHIYRNGLAPIVIPSALRHWTEQQQMELTGETIEANIADSGELGYSYGSYRLLNERRETSEAGHYLRVWKLDVKSRWRIVFDVTNPLP